MRVIVCMTAFVVVSLASSVSQFKFDPLSDEQIFYINNVAKTTWKAGRNFDPSELENVKAKLGVNLKENARMNKIHLKEKKVVVRDDLPKEYDPRDHYPHCKSLFEIRDQASCGSCWAFGAVEAMSDRICIKSGKNVHISAEDLLSCCYTCGFGCHGGYLYAAWAHFLVSGLVTGGQYGSNEGCRPYSIPKCEHHHAGKYPPCAKSVRTPLCEPWCRKGYNVSYIGDKHHGKEPHLIKGVDAIAQEIVDHGPVEAAFEVYEDFLSYKSGVYQHVTGDPLGGHAIKIMGFGVENGTDYWLVANSWNEDWGDKGFFKIAKGTDESGIENQIVAAEVF